MSIKHPIRLKNKKAKKDVRVQRVRDKIDLRRISKISDQIRTLTVDELKSKLPPRDADDPKNHIRIGLEHRLIMLKILQFRGMDYSTTAKELNVCRQSLMQWANLYGPTIFVNRPATEIANAIEIDILKTRAKVESEALAVVSTGLQKLHTMVKDATVTTKNIYALSEAIRTASDVLTALDERANKDGGGGQTTNFFGNIFNNMFKTDQNGNQGGPIGDIKEYIEP